MVATEQADLTAYMFTHQHGIFYLFSPGIASCADVPVGHQFGAVYPPSNSVTSPFYRRWCYAIFEVVVEQKPKVDRYYREVQKRVLTDGEQAHFERLVREFREAG